MKKSMFLLPMILISTAINGQEINYYQGKDTLHIGNEVYKIYRRGTSSIYFYNIKNDGRIDNPVYPDGRPVPRNEWGYDIDNDGDNKGVYRAIRETFTAEEMATLYDEDVFIFYYVIPDGTVTDVKFSFSQEPVFFSIPPERWAVLEEKIKEYKKFQLRGAERFKYVVPGGNVRFKNVYDE